jgi:outer membrane protein TolC
VVIAQTTLLSDQETLVGTQVSEMTSAVQLILALGGGWDKSQLPTVEQVTKRPAKTETKIQH